MSIVSKLNILDKIDKLRDIAKETKTAVIVILESKLHNIVFDLAIHIENYEILRFYRNCHGRGVACYIKSDISYKISHLISLKTENMFSINPPMITKT